MNATARRAARQLPAVSGTVAVLQPIGAVNENTGEIAINGKAYFCRCYPHSFELIGFDSKRNETTTYNLPADLSSCECWDWLLRHDKREDGRCKHQKAVAALIERGHLPRLMCNPIPRVDDLVESDEATPCYCG